MGAILSSISGQFTKSLVLGTFLPVVLFSLAFLFVMQPSLPVAFAVPALLAKMEPQWQLLLFTLLMIAAAGILYHLNIAVLRLYEGYLWENTWWGQWRKDVQAAYWTSLSSHRVRMRKLENELKQINQAPYQLSIDGMSAARQPIGLILNEAYPYSEATVLPTRFGNVIRNCEEYVSKRYGVSAIPIWPRLIAKIDPTYAAQMDDAKVSLDFMVNCSFLSGLVAALGAWFTLASLSGREPLTLVAPIIKIFGFGLISWLFYKGAIGRAAAWGVNVKAAFDLYRLPLLTQLGYDEKPKTLEAEQAMWRALATEYSFPDWSKLPQAALPYSASIDPAPTFSVAVPAATTTLTYSRGITPPPATPYPLVTVTVRVQNTGTVDAASVMVTDVVPPNWNFVWGSAGLAGAQRLTPQSSSPLTFDAGPLVAGATLTLSYNIQSLIN